MRFEDIPMMSGNTAVLGHFSELRRDRFGLMNRIAAHPSELVRLRTFGQTLAFATAPRAVSQVLVEKARSFEKSPVLRAALYPLAGRGLFTSEGELWRRQRKLMSPLFRFKGLRRYADCMAACAERCADDWRDGEVVDIARETTRIAMSVAGKTLFDADTFSDADELGAALTTALNWTNQRTASPLLLAQVQCKTALMRASHRTPAPFAAWLKQTSDAMVRPLILPGASATALRGALDVLERRVKRMIAERRSAANPPDDLLTRLLSARDDADGATMSDKQVRDEILTLFIAGHETTASGLAWSLYLMLRHPDSYRRAQAEVDAITSEHIGFDDLPGLGYCLKVFKEALRMYAPIYIFGRQAIEPVDIAGCHFPRGKIILVSPYVTHHRRDVWPDPDRFDPDRFDAEAEKARPRGAYLPFSDGPRTCIGNHFALMEGPIVLASLLRRAAFTLASDQPCEAEGSATLRPKGGIPVRVSLRS